MEIYKDLTNPDNQQFEKLLNSQLSKISIEEYNDACKKAVMKYTDIWNELTERIGYWVDMDNPYITYKAKYIESVWWSIKELYK